MASVESIYGKKDARDLKLLVVLGRTVQSVERRMIPQVTSTGLTPAQFSVLEMLYHKGSLTVNEIITKTLSSSGNIGVVISNLIKLGWVVKTVDATDRRVRHVALTEEGKAKIGGYFPEHFAEIRTMFSCLTTDEKELLIELLKKLGKNV